MSIVLFCTALVGATAHVAVLDLESSSNISKEETKTISDRLESEIALTKSVVLLERRRIQEILKEQGFQQTGACEGASCQVQVGQLLGVDQIVTGSVGKVGSIYSLNVKLIDVQSGAILQTKVVDVDGDLSALLIKGCNEVAQVFFGPQDQKPEETKNYKWWWISGAIVTTAIVGGVYIVNQDDSKSTETIDRNRSLK